MTGILSWPAFFVHLAGATSTATAAQKKLDTATIERVTGVKGTW